QQTGGNYMADGIGAAMQTTLVYQENGNNQTNVNTRMQNYLGIQNYHVVADPNNTYIDHIDCWAKLLAPDKILVRSVPTSHAQYDEIEAAANYFATHNNSWGYPYRVYRVNTPSNQPYTNSLILNKRVFVPTVGGAYDAAALQVYRDAMPGYEVIGVPQASSTPWESTDALHCRTREIPDKEMLHIAHMPKHGIVDLADSLLFNADITAHSGQPLYSDSLYISYKIAGSAWQQSMLYNQSRNSFTGWISGYAPGDTIRYYIHAADQSGRSYDHPVFAALDPHLFVIQPDQEAPAIAHTPLTTISNQAQPVSFIATVTDNMAVSQVLFRYRIDNGPSLQIPMDPLGNNMYIFQFYTAFEPQDEYLYYSFLAYDNANPPNMQMAPPDDAWWQVEVETTALSDSHAPGVEGIRAVYPNPFNPLSSGAMTIAYAGRANIPCMLKIFNIKGQLVHEAKGHTQSGTKQDFRWNGKDLNGNYATSGLYFIQISSGSQTHKSKLIITK
nr:agmatine deiminase family protein [Candidatus Cloacimonadota bacterium]